jgi:RNA polymerase sigma-70 factor (ECF subfamily)
MDDGKRMDVVGLLGPLRRYARALTRDESQAEDLVQDTLVRAYERRGSFRLGGNLRVWLLSILHNTFIDERRRRNAESLRIEQLAEVATAELPADQESRVRFQQIRQAFLCLPDEQRSALHLVAVEGLSYQEAAAALGIPTGTLMSRLGRARAALRAFEAGQGPLQIATGQRPNLRVVGGSHE